MIDSSNQLQSLYLKLTQILLKVGPLKMEGVTVFSSSDHAFDFKSYILGLNISPLAWTLKLINLKHSMSSCTT